MDSGWGRQCWHPRVSESKKDLTFLCQEMSASGKSRGGKKRQAEMGKAQREAGRIGISFERALRKKVIFQAP